MKFPIPLRIHRVTLPFFIILLLPAITLAGDSLIDSLDLSRPELASVRAAYEKGDVAGARTAFAGYLRTRANVKWKIDPDHPPTAFTAKEKAEADEIMAHKMRSEANDVYLYQFGNEIGWTFDPTTLPTSTIPATPEWTWAFNRHRIFAKLARAYNATGDAKYGLEFSNEIQSWIRTQPPLLGAVGDGPGSAWRGIESGFRMSATWPEAYFRLIHHPDAFPDDALLAMVNSIRTHGENLDVLTVDDGHGNHTAVELFGLYAVGSLFPEFKQAAQWRDDAMKRQSEEIDAEVYPDGVQKELAPGYAGLALSSFTGTLELAEMNGYTAPADYLSKIEKMYTAMMWSMSPDRCCPPFNDSGASDRMELLKQGLTHFPNRADLQWFASDEKQGHPPEDVSHLLQYPGWPAMRSSWERDAQYLLMECGPFGMGHQHEDKLSFILHAYGSSLVTEASTCTYDVSVARAYCRSALAHNLIQIDGMEQNRRGGPSEYFVTKKPIEVNWHDTPQYDYAEGSYGQEPDERWGKHRITGYIHTRRVLFVKPDYWVILDTVRPPENETEHTYESVFHLNAPDARIDPKTNAVRTATPVANLAILPLSNAEMNVHIITAQTDPFYQGWVAKEDDHDQMHPSATPYFTMKCKGPAQYLYVFSPYKPGEKEGAVKSVARTNDASAAMAADLVLTHGGIAHVALLNDDTLTFKFKQSDAAPLRINAIYSR